MTRLLLIEDEPALVTSLLPALKAEGYAVSISGSGADGIARLAEGGIDVVLLDLGLPDIDGKEVISRIRDWSEVPILVLSARHMESEKIAALDRGADDYVAKPFAVGELLARLRAMLRGRDHRFSTESRIQIDELVIDFVTRNVRLGRDEVRLTPKEYSLLKTLARHFGRVVTHRQLGVAIWGGERGVDAQSVRVLVAQLRQKLETEGAKPRFILTEQGVGYRLADVVHRGGCKPPPTGAGS